MAIVISADEIKKELPGYTPDKAEKFHSKSAQLANKESVIFDGTLSSTKRAERKLKKIIETNKIPIIYAVIPDNLKRAYGAFLRRERKFSDAHFYRTHSSSRKTLLWIALNYPRIEINIVESSITSGDLQFTGIKIDNRQKLIKYLTGLQVTQDDIIKQLI